MKPSDFLCGAVVAILFMIICAITDEPTQQQLAHEELQTSLQQARFEEAKLKAQIKAERKRLAKIAEDITNVPMEIKE